MSARAGAAVVLGLLLLTAGLPLQALELTQGKIKLTLAEGVGRFSISFLTAAGAWVPLFSKQDPRTTTVSVVLGNKIFRMGDTGSFIETAKKTPAGARFIWKANFLTVTESFSFVASAGASAADGVRIDLTLKNTSRDDTTAGVRYLFDTYLGESGQVPFATDTLKAIKRETALSGGSLPRWWVSPRENDPEQLGLQCMVTEEGLTQPDRIVFANWKRLSDASWGYDSSSVRDFSLLPYSKKDSAVAEYFDPRPLARGSQFTVTLVLGKFNPAGFPATSAMAAGTGDFAASVEQSLAAGKDSPGSPTSLRADLDTVDTILSRIDAGLAPGADITESDLSLMESAITDLKSRASTYK